MTKTLAVLGIDAADYRLARHWDCSNILLDNSQDIQTFSYSLDVPATLEVWPTIATGKLPQEHGIVLDQVGWDNTAGLSIIVRMTRLLPERIRSSLVRLKESQFGSSVPQVESTHVFDRGSVYNWPGVTPCFDWNREGDWFREVTSGDLSEQEFRRRHLGNAGKGVGWLAGQSIAGVPIAGAHVHYLDHMSHLYAKRPDSLKSVYEEMDALVGWLRKQIDRLVIVSDHGMQTTRTDDPDPGVHSRHALIATTEAGALPKSVTDVRDWLEERIEVSVAGMESVAAVDAPMEHLRDLGYL